MKRCFLLRSRGRMRRALGVLVVGLAVARPAAAQEAPEPTNPSAPGHEASAADAFGPRYVLEGIEVRGNRKTRAPVILSQILVRAGDVIAADDARVEASRFRLLGTGFCEDVRLALRRAQSRGRVVLVVDVSERGTIIINELFLGSSEATPVWAGFDIGENNFLGHGIALSTGFVVGAQADVPGAQTQQA